MKRTSILFELLRQQDRSAFYAFGDSGDLLLIYEPTIRQVVVIEGD